MTQIDRRTFIGAAALSGLAAGAVNAAEKKTGTAGSAAGGDSAPLPAEYFNGPTPDIPQLGLRWAFSVRVFFVDRVLLNTMESATGRGYTAVGGGDIWGPKLQGRVLPHSGADYYHSSFTTYYMLEASDGALIFIHNRGTMRRFGSPEGTPYKELKAPADAKDVKWTRFRAHPVFTAPNGPHSWMNDTVFVANSQRQANPDHTVFTYYEVL